MSLIDCSHDAKITMVKLLKIVYKVTFLRIYCVILAWRFKSWAWAAAWEFCLLIDLCLRNVKNYEFELFS